jgi:hypothetical protein
MPVRRHSGLSEATFGPAGAEDALGPTPEELRRIQALADLMDSRFSILGVRFGWDSIIGLVPGIGDVATSLVSLVILGHAWRMGLPAHLKARMLANVGIDFVLGAVPLLGDVFDLAFKANRRNVRLLRRHLERRARR